MSTPRHVRVWDKVDKCMITDEQEFIPLKITNKGILRLDPMHREDLWVLIPFGDRFIAMEGSGMPDLYGKEIYEGMQVKQVDTLTGGDSVFIGEVKQYEGAWWIDNGVSAVPLWNECSTNVIVSDYLHTDSTTKNLKINVKQIAELKQLFNNSIVSDSKLTCIGQILARLRRDNSELLGEMAKKLGFTLAELSAIQIGKANMSPEKIVLLLSLYEFTAEERYYLANVYPD